MKKMLLLILFSLIGIARSSFADCNASPLSSPDDIFGQRFDCDDGSTATYHRSFLGDYIEKDGERYDADIFTDESDEYDSILGRRFGDISLKRGELLGDRLEGFESTETNEFTDKSFTHLNKKTVPPFKSKTQKKSKIKKPQGWDVQYVDMSCIVSTGVKGKDEKSSWKIKMGHIAGNQLILIFSAFNYKLKDVTIPSNLDAFFVIDDNKYEAISISNVSGELVIAVENSIKIQKALSSATSLGISIKSKNKANPIKIAGFKLGYIPEANNWLKICNVLGIKALP